jgi:hypothetical protein
MSQTLTPPRTDRPSFRDRLPYVGAIVALAPAILQAWEDGQLALAGLATALLLVNLATLVWLARRRLLLPVTVNLLNAALAFAMAWQTTLQAKRWLPYSWLLTGLVFLVVAAVVLPQKYRRERPGGGEGPVLPSQRP